MSGQGQTTGASRRANLGVAAACIAAFGSMLGLAYASVPLYKLFCQVTGFGGTTQVAEAAPEQPVARMIKVRFDGNVTAGMPWDFSPDVREVELQLGETRQVSFTARNTTNRDVTGTATFNVTPEIAGAYFNKLECFCFTETTLKPGESLNMPVVFFIDPAILDDAEARRITTITLSYTFFETVPQQPTGAQALAKPAASGTTVIEDGRG
jgi:cytochrome c oxidase assembly protein subunit 11